MKHTNLNKAKDIAYYFLNLDVKETELDFILSHPFISSRYMTLSKDDMQLTDVCESEENLDKARKLYKQMIDEADSLALLFMILNKPYRAVFFKMISSYLSERDYNEFLQFVWVDSENPNQDVNVSINDWIKLFKKGNKDMLMSDEDRDIYDKLPNDELITIYRGITKGHAEKGLSWTNNICTAEWFAKRFNNKEPYMLKAQCHKEDIFAYLNERGEDELVVNVKKILNVERINLYGNDQETEDS